MRLARHRATKALAKGAEVEVTAVRGGKTAREVAEYHKIRKIIDNPNLSVREASKAGLIQNRNNPIGGRMWLVGQ